jgi:hypothetical protein
VNIFDHSAIKYGKRIDKYKGMDFPSILITLLEVTSVLSYQVILEPKLSVDSNSKYLPLLF